MAFIRLNGWEIEVTSCSQREELFGTQRRAFDGGLLDSRRAVKRVWRCTTKPLDEIEAEALRGLLLGYGDHWPLDNSLYSDKGLGPSTTNGVVFQPRFGDDGGLVEYGIDSNDTPLTNSRILAAQYGSHSAYFGTSHTNLLSVNQASVETDTTGFTVVNTSTLTRDGTQYYTGDYSLKCTPSGGASLDGFYVDVNSTVTAGTIFGSAFVRHAGSTPVTLQCYLYNNAGATQTGPVHQFSLGSSDEWVRIYADMVMTATANPGDLRMYITEDAPGFLDRAWYTDGLMIGKASVTSTSVKGGPPWLAGGTSYSAGNVFYNGNYMTGAPGATLIFWGMMDASAGHGRFNQPAIYIHDGDGVWGDRIQASAGNGTHGDWQIVDHFGTSQTLTLTDPSAEGMYMYSLVVRPNAETGENQLTWRYNDASPQTAALTPQLDFSHLNRIRIGSSTGNRCEQIQDEVTVVPYAMTNDQIEGIYNMGKQLPIMPAFYVDGDLAPDNELTILAEGRITNQNFLRGSKSSTGVYNKRIVEFEIMEI